MALTYSQKHGLWTQSYDATELGITPGVTPVNATPFTKLLPWEGFREHAGFMNVTTNGNTLSCAFRPVAADGVTAYGNGLVVALPAASTLLTWAFGPGFANNGQWDIFGVGNGNFNQAGNFPLAGVRYMMLTVTRTGGAATSTLGNTNIFLRS